MPGTFRTMTTRISLTAVVFNFIFACHSTEAPPRSQQFDTSLTPYAGMDCNQIAVSIGTQLRDSTDTLVSRKAILPPPGSAIHGRWSARCDVVYEQTQPMGTLNFDCPADSLVPDKCAETRNTPILLDGLSLDPNARPSGVYDLHCDIAFTDGFRIQAHQRVGLISAKDCPADSLDPDSYAETQNTQP